MVIKGLAVLFAIALTCFFSIQFYAFRRAQTASSFRLYTETELRDYDEESTNAPTTPVVNTVTAVVEERETVTPSPPLREERKNGSIVIPFYRKSWYLLFRHYQKEMRKRALNSRPLFSYQPPYSLYHGDRYSLLYADRACINSLKHEVYFFDSSEPSVRSSHLRPSTNFHPYKKPIQFSGYEGVSFFFVNSSFPSLFPDSPSNLTWVLLTPPASQNECVEAFHQYFPPFYQSLHPLFSSPVLCFPLHSL